MLHWPRRLGSGDREDKRGEERRQREAARGRRKIRPEGETSLRDRVTGRDIPRKTRRKRGKKQTRRAQGEPVREKVRERN